MASSTNPKITVIVPVFNTEDYVKECLLSILNQGYPGLELIVIDDGSTDESPEILKKLNDKYDFIIHRQENKGLSASRNQGLEMASGDYIFFVDSDDWIQENTFSLLSDFINANPTIDMIRFNAAAFVDGSAETLRQEQYDFGDQLTHNSVYEEKDKTKLYQTYSSSACLYCVRRNLLEQHNLFFEEGIIHEDELFTTKLFLMVKQFGYINKALYRRRYRENSLMTNESREHQKKSFDSYVRVIQELEELLQTHKVTEEEKEFVQKRIRGMLQVMYTRDIEKSYKNDQLEKLESYDLREKLRLSAKKILRKI